MKDKMSKTLEMLSQSIIGIRGCSAGPGIIDTIKMDYYGQKMSMSQIAQTISIDNIIAIELFDPSVVLSVVATLKNNGFSAYQFSKTRVVVSMPPVSGEELEKVKKHLRKIGEEAKIAIRNIRKNHRKNADKSEDKEIQKTTDYYIKEIDQIIESKIKSL